MGEQQATELLAGINTIRLVLFFIAGQMTGIALLIGIAWRRR